MPRVMKQKRVIANHTEIDEQTKSLLNHWRRAIVRPDTCHRGCCRHRQETQKTRKNATSNFIYAPFSSLRFYFYKNLAFPICSNFSICAFVVRHYKSSVFIVFSFPFCVSVAELFSSVPAQEHKNVKGQLQKYDVIETINHHAHRSYTITTGAMFDPINCYFRDSILESDASVARSTKLSALDKESEWETRVDRRCTRTYHWINYTMQSSNHTLHSIALRTNRRIAEKRETVELATRWNAAHRRYVNVHMEMIILK